LDWLEQIIYQLGFATNQCYLKVIRDSSGHETDRTIAFIDQQIYHKLSQQNRADLSIEPFVVQPGMHPKLDQYTYNFCIPFPKETSISTTTSDKLFLTHIEQKLAPFIDHGIIPYDSYNIHVPVVSREKNLTKGIAFISFHSSINRDILACIRLILDGCRWQDNVSPMRWFWARIPTKGPRRDN
jgi:hypothetical protein